MENTSSHNKCEYLRTCNFFADTMASVPHLSASMQGKYCYKLYLLCARHTYAKIHGLENVPEDLFPNSNPL